MTRLETNGEPSMEEILASIRRIIAEDPPASRHAAPPAAAPAPAPRNISASLEITPATPAAAPAPAAASPVRVTIGREPTAAMKPAAMPIRAEAAPVATAISSAPVTARETIETSTSAVREDAAKPAAREAVRNADAADPVATVDAQLSGLFDDLEPSPPIKLTPAQQQQNGKSVEPRQVRGATSAASSREQSQFTVTRDGYVPPAPPIDAAADPFDFDLGPSPFAKISEAEPVPEPARASAPTADAGKPEVGSSDRGLSSSNLVRQPAAAPAMAAAVKAAEAAPRESAAVKVETPAKPAVEPKTVAPLAAPSIAATLPPAREAQASRATIDAGFSARVDRMSSRSAHDAIGDVVTEAVSSAMAKQPRFSAVEMGDKPIAVEVDDALTPRQQLAVRGEAVDHPNLPALRQGDGAIRTMEDTVADLLRPMLKSWLAENMPKIIERALRREISEMNLPMQSHKTAAE